MVDQIKDLEIYPNVVKPEQTDHINSQNKSPNSNVQSNQNQNNNSKSLNDLGKKLGDFQKIVKVSFDYQILKNPNMIVLKIVDQSNGEVIRQIPPEEAVKLAKAIDELMGIFVDKHV